MNRAGERRYRRLRHKRRRCGTSSASGTGDPPPHLAQTRVAVQRSHGGRLHSAVAGLMFPYFDARDLAMVYLLGVVITASRTSTWPSLFATILSVAAFDFFFVPPYYTFAVSDVRYFVTFIVMFIVSFVISRLTLRVRQQAEAARLRERRTAALYNLSRDLVRERGTERLERDRREAYQRGLRQPGCRSSSRTSRAVLRLLRTARHLLPPINRN